MYGPKLLLLPSVSFYQDMYPVRAANIRHIPDNFWTLLEEELVNVDILRTSLSEDLWFTVEHSIVSVLKKMKLLRRKFPFVRKPWFSPEIRQLISLNNQKCSIENAATLKEAIRIAKDAMWNSLLLSRFTIVTRSVKCGSNFSLQVDDRCASYIW